MSVMTERLGAREVGDGGTVVDEVSITELPLGRAGTVARLCVESDAATTRRYFDLGFVPGAHVVAVRRAPMRGPVVVRVAGYEIALRRHQADCIKVVVTR